MSLGQWKAYKAEYGKSYLQEEDAKRYQVFKESWKEICRHNRKYQRGEVTYAKGLSQFSDWIPFAWVDNKSAKEVAEYVDKDVEKTQF